jgi:hypothetical protein
MESTLGILIIVAFVGFIGYHIWQDKKKEDVPAPKPKPAPKKKAGGGRPKSGGGKTNLK